MSSRPLWGDSIMPVEVQADSLGMALLLWSFILITAQRQPQLRFSL